jgi:hypothetical protein
MPLHFGKIAAGIALLTVGAFILWLLLGSLLTGERADQQLERASETAAPGAPAGPGQ